MSDPPQAHDPLEQISSRLDDAAARLRAEDLDAAAAAELIDECARLASEAASELDRRVRSAIDGTAAQDVATGSGVGGERFSDTAGGEPS